MKVINLAFLGRPALYMINCCFELKPSKHLREIDLDLLNNIENPNTPCFIQQSDLILVQSNPFKIFSFFYERDTKRNFYNLFFIVLGFFHLENI